jgi:tetratricopeptide (TPR) repeat protein
MQTTAKTSRFLIDFLSNRGFNDSESLAGHGDLFKCVLSQMAHTINSRQIFNEFAQTLIRIAEHAYSLRDITTIQETGEILTGLPIKTARQIGLYYRALAINRKGRRNEAERLLEQVAESAPLVYRARAIQTLGANYLDKGRLGEALRLQLEALRVASDKNAHSLFVKLLVHFEMSRTRSYLGDSQGAFDILASLSPMVRTLAKERPLYWYFYHNELAVELAELGRIAEAKAACRIAITSPYTHAYPEWTETSKELEEKVISPTPSVIHLSQAAEPESTSSLEPKRGVNPVKAVALRRPREPRRQQDATVLIAASGAIAGFEIVQRPIEFLCDPSQPRAPPAFTRSI